jgi:excisionase family DNA binding protein
MLQKKAWVSVSDAARRLGTPRSSVYRLIEHGELTVRKLPGGRPRVPADEITHLVEASTRQRRPVEAATP